MKYTSAHKILFIVVVLLSFALYAATVYRGVPFWESGDYYSAVMNMGNAHPPAAPFFLLLANIFAILMPVSEPSWQYNLVNALFAAGATGVLYLLGTRMTWSAVTDREVPEIPFVVHGAGLVTALTAAVASTFWASALQMQVYTFAALLSLLIIWLGFLAYDAEKESTTIRIILFIAFISGLGTGVHWSVLYAVLPVMFLLYFRYYYFTPYTFTVYAVLALSAYIILRFVVFAIPGLGGIMFGPSSAFFSISVLTGLGMGILIFSIFITRTQLQLATLQAAAIAGVLFLVGYTTFLMVPLRAGTGVTPDYGEPVTAESFAAYAAMEMPGKQPPLLDRRWSDTPEAQSLYAEYDSDWDFFTEFQIEHMFFRYIFWNFIGKAGDALHAPAYYGEIAQGPVYGSWAWFKGAYPQNYYAIPFLLGVVGMLRLFFTRPVVGVTLFLMFGLFGFWMAVAVNVAPPFVRDVPYLYLTAIATFALWVGAGAATLVSWITRLFTQSDTFGMPAFRNGIAVVLFAALIAAVPGNMLSENYAAMDASDEYIAQDFAYNLLQSCEEDAVLFTAGDNDTYTLEYLQGVLQIRPDVCVVNLSLLNTGWYSLQVKHRLNRGKTRTELSYDDTDIEFLSGTTPIALSRTAWPTDQKQITIPVPKPVMDEYISELPKGMQLRIRRRSGNEMSFLSQAQYPFEVEGSDGLVRYYRPWKDLMVEDIVRASAWKRPVYFAVTCSREDFLGMDDFLRLDGMAYRVTPVRYTAGYYVHYASLIDQLLYPAERYSTSYKPGFVMRKYGKQHFRSGEEVHGIIGNYRNAYMQLAKYQIAALKSPEGAIATLNAMKKFVPEDEFPLDYHYAFDIALLYRDAGSRRLSKAMMNRVEKLCLREIQRDPENVQSIYSPYRYLYEMYMDQGRFKKARNLLDTMAAYVPEAMDIEQRRIELDSLLANQ